MKRANLHILDKDVVVFAAGNYVQIINLKSKEHKYIRSTSGGGIGAITVSVQILFHLFFLSATRLMV